MPDDFSIITDFPDLARKYAGQWVAVRGGEIIAQAEKEGQLFRKLRSQKVRGVVTQYVPPLGSGDHKAAR